MNAILAGVALAAIAGSVVAVSFREPRTVVLAIALVLVVSPLLTDPLTDPAGLAARLVGSVLAAYLLWVVVRGSPAGLSPMDTGGSRIGWPAEVLVAGAAAVVGFAAHGLGATAAGPALASAAGFAIAASAVAPVLTGRDAIRVGVGLLLLLDAGLLVRAGLGGTPGQFEQLLTAGLTAIVAAALAAVALAIRRDGVGGFDLALEPGPRRRREPDAHPIADR